VRPIFAGICKVMVSSGALSALRAPVTLRITRNIGAQFLTSYSYLANKKAE
jgi:hypothetical protein